MSSGLEELGIVDDSDEDDDGPLAPPSDGEAPGDDPAPSPDSSPAPSAAAPSPADAAPAPSPDDAGATDAPPVDESSLERTLESVPLFEGLLPTHLRRIAKLVNEVEHRKNEHIFHHGDPGDALYLILEGAIRISREVAGMGEEALAVLKPGMYFGEMAIIDEDATRSADAIVHERARLLRLSRDDLRDLMFVDRELAYELLWRFVRTLGQRVRDSNDRLLMLSVSSKF